MTPFAVQSALLGIPSGARTPVRLGMPEQISREIADSIRDELREFAHLGGFTFRPGRTPWYGAALGTPADARRACDLAARLCSRGLPMMAHRIARACGEAGLRPPGSYGEGTARVRLFAAVAQTLRSLGPEVYASRPHLLAASTGDGAGPGLPERGGPREPARPLPLRPAHPSPAGPCAAPVL